MTKYPLLSTKLILPASPENCLYSPRIRALGIETNRLSVLTAPAGFGKTTAVLLSLEKQRPSIFWYRMEREDSCLPVFYTHFLECLFGSCRDETTECFALLNNIQNMDEDYILLNAQIAEDATGVFAEKKGKRYIVLDDFHNVQENLCILESVRYFIMNLPDCFRFIITSRRESGLISGKLYLKDNIRAISFRELSFSEKEIWELTKNKYRLSISHEQMNYLIKNTEGWIAGIYMICQSFVLSSREEIDRTVKNNTETMFSAFFTVFLENIAEEKKKILLALAPLDDFSLGELTKVYALREGGAFIAWLETSSLYIQKLDGTEVRYRFHALFKEELHRRYRSAFSIAEQRDLYERLAEYYREKSPQKAIHFMLLAGRRQEASDIFREKGKENFCHGDPEGMLYLLNEFSHEEIERDPYLLFYSAMLRINTDREKSYAYLLRAMRGFKRSREYSFLMDTLGMILVFAYQNNNFICLKKVSKEIPFWQVFLTGGNVRIKLLLSIFIFLTGKDHLRSAALLYRFLYRADAEEDMWHYSFLMISGIYYYRRGLLELSYRMQKEIRAHPVFARNDQWRIIGLVSCCNLNFLRGDTGLLSEFANVFFLLGERYHSVFSTGYGHYMEAYNRYLRGEEDKALSSMQSSVDAYAEYGGEILARESEIICHIWNRKSSSQDIMLRLHENLTFFMKETPGHGLIELAHCAIGIVHKRARQFDRAREHFMKALALSKKKDAMQTVSGIHLQLADLAVLEGHTALRDRHFAEWLEISARNAYVFWREIDRESLLRCLDSCAVPEAHTAYCSELLHRYERRAHTALPEKPVLRICFFGAFRLEYGEGILQQEDFKTRKSAYLLQYLMSGNEKETVSREKLMAIFWPESEPRAAQASLRVALYQLRKTLSAAGIPIEGEGALLQESRHGLHITKGLNMERDTLTFERTYEEWKSASQNGNDEEALNKLISLCDIYRGNYMEGFPYEEMLAARQTYYLGLYAEAAHALGEQLIGLRRYEEAEQLLLQVMERDPFDEAACILMIKSCEARGQRARGLSIRRKFTRLYQKEMGVEAFQNMRQ